MDPILFDKAIQSLLSGGVLLFPTDTVYGLGCLPGNAEAVQRIYQIKNRPEGKPLQLLISDVTQVSRFSLAPPSWLPPVLKKCWPGGLTVLLPAKAGLPAPLVGPQGTVGLRFPDDKPLLHLIEKAGSALAATSANLAGQSSPTTLDEIDNSIRRSVDLEIPGGVTAAAQHSTVLDATTRPPKILREGAVSERALRKAGTPF